MTMLVVSPSEYTENTTRKPAYKDGKYEITDMSRVLSVNEDACREIPTNQLDSPERENAPLACRFGVRDAITVP